MGTATGTEPGTGTPASTTTGGSGRDPAGPRNGDQLPKDTKPNDGYPPEFETAPEKRTVDTSSFDTLARSGFEIKLVPTDVAYYWYARGEARFADTRSRSEFDVSHVFGSVLSPAGDGTDLPDDPVLQWPKKDRIVTYCDCPHHLSSLRAASLKNRGYEEVYALDKGFGDWRKRNFPLAGEDVGRVPPTRVIEGKVPRRYAGKWAWAYHQGSDQREASTIQSDGSYRLETKFVDVTAQSTVKVETPAYTVTGTFAELTGGTITADGTVTGSGGGGTTTGTATNGTGTASTGTNTTSTGTATTANGTSTDDSFSFDPRRFLG
jgi:rhodanese-related sulfurtransferase